MAAVRSNREVCRVARHAARRPRLRTYSPILQGSTLLATPVVAYAQHIPDSVVWAAGGVLIAPVIAVPVKRLMARSFGVDIAYRRLLLLCVVEWFLWILGTYLLVVLFRTTGAEAALAVVFVLSVLLHSTTGDRRRRIGLGLLLALATPVIALGLGFAILRSF